MVKEAGTITKKFYCNNCFTAVEWDEVADEAEVMGNRFVICPKCGAHVNANLAEIVYGEGNGEG